MPLLLTPDPITMKPMRYRKLGRTGMEVSDIGYGAWGIGGTQWLGGKDDESVRALNRALESGLEEALEFEAQLQSVAGRSTDHKEGVAAFVEKRPARFTGE